MAPKSISEWEARNETEMLNALDVVYEMAVGFILGEMREQAPEKYEVLICQARKRMQLVNTVRYSIDATINEIVSELVGDRDDKEDV
jgi:hypothetical protein